MRIAIVGSSKTLVESVVSVMKDDVIILSPEDPVVKRLQKARSSFAIAAQVIEPLIVEELPVIEGELTVAQRYNRSIDRRHRNKV